MWSQRYPIAKQLTPLILGFILVFTLGASLTWYFQLRRMRLVSLEQAALQMAAPFLRETKQALDQLHHPPFDKNRLLFQFQRRGDQLFPAFLETIEDLDGVRVVDPEGRTLFSRGKVGESVGAEWRPSRAVTSRRREGRIEIVVPILWGQEILAGVVCLYNRAAGEVHTCRCWYTGLGVTLLLGLLGGVGGHLMIGRLSRSLKSVTQHAESIAPDSAMPAASGNPGGEVYRLSRSLQRLERLVAASESKCDTLMEAAQDGIAVVGALDTNLIYANPRLGELVGCGAAKLAGRSIFDFIFPEEHDRYRQLADDLIENPRRSFIREVRLRHQSGREVLVEVNITPLFLDEVLCGLIICRDLSARLQTELRLKTLFTAIEHADEEVLITDHKARIQYVNPAFEKNSGYLSREVIGQNPRLLKSGEQNQAFYQEMWRTLMDGKVWRGRIINRCKDGRHTVLDANISPIIDTRGTITGFVAVRRDVAEKVQLERQLVQSQKMEAIGTLAGGIAHDFNNILAGILGYAELALLDLEPDTEVSKNLTQIHRAGQRARELVQQILAYSRQSKNQPRLLDVRALLKETLEFLRASLPANIKIERDIAHEAAVFADASHIHQIIMNLSTNAAHAMAPQGGLLTVTLEKENVGRDHELTHKGLAPGIYLRLAISDTGQGMSKTVQKRVFDPYFTTKERGKGTGMGLAVVHGIVQQLGGRIFLKSQVGAGSRFSVYLPAVDADVESAEMEGTALYQGQGVAIFVDDEAPLVEIGCRMLARMGFAPRGFDSSNEALTAFEADPAKVDLVVTDMAMPEMTGDVLAGRMLARRPDLPVILCSGFSEHIDEAQAMERGIGVFLNKPFRLQDLAVAVKSLMANIEKNPSNA